MHLPHRAFFPLSEFEDRVGGLRDIEKHRGLHTNIES